jgi:hypothetical protein
MHQIHPTVGQWYLQPSTGRKFAVIDIDGDGMIEIQDDEGTLDAVDPDSWFTGTLEATDQPQYFLGALDNLSEPDEADGGDPIGRDALDTAPLRVAQDEMLNAAQDADDEPKEQDESDLQEGNRQ